jgi:hypothetical protein
VQAHDGRVRPRGFALSIAMLLLVACSQSGPSSRVSPSAASSAAEQRSPVLSPQASPILQPSATPPKPTIRLLKSGYNCRLPVTWAGGPGNPLPIYAGLLDLSNGSIILSDPQINNPNTYTWALGKWLPVRWQWVAPDGRQYAYGNETGLHMVDVSSSRDRLLAANAYPIDWSAEGIYAYDSTGSSARPALQLVRFNPNTGTRVVLYQGDPSDGPGGPQNVRWDWISGADAWAVAVIRDSSGGLVNLQVVRLDMSTGSVSVWLDDPGRSLALIGVDSRGRPFVTINTGSRFEVWLGSSPGTFQMIGDGSALGIDGYSRTLTSGPVTWFTTKRNTATFYSDSSGFVDVAQADGSTPFLDPGGSCQK